MRTAVIVLHEYLGSRDTLAYISNALEEAGFRVFAPNLKGHGGCYRELGAVKYEDWLEQIEIVYEEVSREYDSIFILGLSLGGLLALNLSRLGKDIKGIVLINPLYSPPFYFYLTPILRYIIKYVPALPPDVKEREVKCSQYSWISVANTAELLKLCRLTMREIDKIDSELPILMFKSTSDNRLSYLEGLDSFRAFPSRKKEFIILNDSYHLAVLDRDKELIRAGTIKFINNFNAE